MALYVLPDLDYDLGALAPHISGEIMELHHGKHHKTYVDKANETIEKLDQARGKEDFSRLAGLERALAFNVSTPSSGRIWPRGEARSPTATLDARSRATSEPSPPSSSSSPRSRPRSWDRGGRRSCGSPWRSGS